MIYKFGLYKQGQYLCEWIEVESNKKLKKGMIIRVKERLSDESTGYFYAEITSFFGEKIDPELCKYNGYINIQPNAVVTLIKRGKK